MPFARLAVRAAYFRSIFLKEGSHRNVAVHRSQHFDTRLVEPNKRIGVVERSEPPFVIVMLIGDEIRNPPGPKSENLFGQADRLLHCGGWLHGGDKVVKKSTVHDGPRLLQEDPFHIF